MSSFILVLLVFFPIIMGIATYFISKVWSNAKEVLSIVVSIIEFALMIYVIFAYPITNTFLNMEFVADGFRSIYALVASFMWMCTIIFSKEYMHHYANKDRYYLFYLLTLGATVGVFYSNDLWTTFMFFEMMSLTSYVLVIHDQKKESMDAGLTYLAIAIISGMILLMGIFLIYSEFQTTNFKEIYELCKGGLSSRIYAAGILLLLGFGAKAGMFPLHIWLPKAHPVAPAPASALLSGILTKAGVFGIIICVVNIFFAVESFAIILLILALITMLLGAILAVFSVNFKRTLACSSMSQIGFILTGLAMMIFLKEHNAIAMEGSFLHMLNHSLIKLVLFMVAGVIFMNIHKLNLNDIRGFGRNKWFIKICFLIGMLGIMGIPMFNGYISKTLIHEAIVEYGLTLTGLSKTLITVSEYVFLFSGGLTIAYMLKIFNCVFIEKNNDEKLQQEYDSKKNYISLPSKIVIGLSAIILPFLGFMPSLTSNNLASIAASFFNVDLHHMHFPEYFNLTNLKGALISIVIGVAVYFLIIKLLFVKRDENGNKVYVDLWPKWLDLECIYKKVLFFISSSNIIRFIVKGISELLDMIIYFICSSKVIRFIVKGISELLDMIIYLFRKYILRQNKYKFNSIPSSYKFGRKIDKLYKRNDNYYANKTYGYVRIVNNVFFTMTSTFAYDFLMACIGLVVSLLIIVL